MLGYQGTDSLVELASIVSCICFVVFLLEQALHVYYNPPHFVLDSSRNESCAHNCLTSAEWSTHTPRGQPGVPQGIDKPADISGQPVMPVCRGRPMGGVCLSGARSPLEVSCARSPLTPNLGNP
eukprot:1181915-Prorocentrum_minimum.AAC.3